MTEDTGGPSVEDERLLGQPRAQEAETLSLEPSSSDSSQESAYTAYFLYSSHFLSAWGQRMWEFAVGLVMLDLGSGSLLLVSIFGLLDGLAVVVAGPLVGSWIDRTERLTAACTMYLLQNTAVAISACSSLVALSLQKSSLLAWGFATCTILLGSVSSAGALGATLSVEREWTKALCQGDPGRLANLNAGMRRVDLTCLILSPIMVGLLMTNVGNKAAVIVIVGWNVLAWAPEWLLLRQAQSTSRALRERKPEPVATKSKWSLWYGWIVYTRQPVLPAAFALALLYLTVLSFGLLSTAYLKWRGMSEAELSIYRGLGAAAGMSATFVFPPLAAKLGLNASGALGIWWQLLSLAAAIGPALVGGMSTASVAAPLVTHFLVGGLLFSRFGLWLFDLCVSQLLQELVASEELGVVNGVQGSLASLFQSASYAAGLLCPDPQRFEWLMLSSWLMVLCAAITYTVYVVTSKGSSGT